MREAGAVGAKVTYRTVKGGLISGWIYPRLGVLLNRPWVR